MKSLRLVLCFLLAGCVTQTETLPVELPDLGPVCARPGALPPPTASGVQDGSGPSWPEGDLDDWKKTAAIWTAKLTLALLIGFLKALAHAP
jgi:hypothetical protein